MEKKNFIIAASLAALAVVSITTALTATHSLPLHGVFATQTKNEYGCVSGCTGEYYPSHVKQILSSDTSKNGSKNVRIKCEYVKDVYFKDIGAKLTYQASSDNNAMALDITFTWWNENTGDLRSQVKEGDTICLFGTVSYEIYGVRRLVVRDPVIYAVNGTVKTSLLPPVNYID